MKKIQILMVTLLSLTVGQVFAQLNGNGFYRVRNYDTERYITIHDDQGSVGVKNKKIVADMGALELVSDFSNVVSDPGSIIYIQSMSGGYNLLAQGVNTYSIIGYPVRLAGIPGGLYQASVLATYNGTTGTVVLGDDPAAGISISADYNFWYVLPVNNTGDNYFAAKPDFSVDGKYYTTMYTSFAYQLSSGVKAYYVSGFDDENRAELTEILGKVPAETAVILECSSSNYASNKLVPTTESVPAITGTNYLKGVYFNINKKSGGYNHKNQTAYDAATMRVLGSNGGKLGFATSSSKVLEANKAYLELPAGKTFDSFVKISEPEVITPISVTANDIYITYGDPIPELTYSVSGGTITGTPELKCNAEQGSPSGVYPIFVSRGSVEESNATFYNGNLFIALAPLTVSAGNYTMKQGEPLPQFKATYEGFVNGQSEAYLDKPADITTTATSNSPVGVYDVVVSGAEISNYYITYVNGKLTIEENPDLKPYVTLTANSYTITYGDAIPEFGFTQDVDVDLGGTPVLSCDVNEKSPVGTYPIVIAQGTVSYDRVQDYVNGTLTIEPAQLTASVGDYTMTYGQPVPDFQVIVEGFVNNENESVLAALPVATTTATSQSSPGTYPITVSGGEAQNYVFGYQNGTLTINDLDAIIVRVGNYTMGYGDELPQFEYTVSGGNMVGEPEIICEATPQSPAGNYTIRLERGTIQNPRASFYNGRLTIEKAPLTISVGEYTREYGQPNPDFELIYEGFKNDDDQSALTTQPIITCLGGQYSGEGDYVIMVYGATAHDYKITHVNGILHITADTAIRALLASGQPFDVYAASGVRVRTQATSLQGLPAGLYVINGHKVVVR